MTHTLSIHNEFRQLHEAIVCRPEFYTLTPPINSVEARYLKKKKSSPKRERLLAEHERWCELLQELGVELSFLEPTEGLPHQMFTRDIGFVIGEKFYLGNMARKIRQPESDILEKWLRKEKISYKTISEGTIEGGDVLVHAPYVFVGITRRTNRAGAEALATLLGPDWHVIPIKIAREVLHLDCVMAILNHHTMIWSPNLIEDNHDILRELFRTRIKIDKYELFHMAANVLTVNIHNVLVEKRQKRLQRELRKVGIKVHPIDWSETKKLGGLFRCATLPLG